MVNLHTVLGGLLFFGAVSGGQPNASAAEKIATSQPSSSRASFRPAISLAYMHVEGPAITTGRMRASWAGLDAQADLIANETDRFEWGLTAGLLSSIFGLSQDAFEASMTEASGRAYALMKFPTSAMGLVHARIEMGYFGNWRFNSATSNFLDPFLGPQVRAKISTSFDESIRFGRIGFVASYGFASEGVVQGGVSLSHRLAHDVNHPWDLVLNAMLGMARAKGQQENWSTIEIGLSGAI